jgi:hypothetical protein
MQKPSVFSDFSRRHFSPGFLKAALKRMIKVERFSATLKRCFPLLKRCFPLLKRCFPLLKRCFPLLKRCFPLLNRGLPANSVPTLHCFRT